MPQATATTTSPQNHENNKSGQAAHGPHRLSSMLRHIIFYLFLALLAITPFLFTWVNEELFEFNKMLFVYASTTLITACWLGRIISEQRLIFRRTVLDWPLAIFLGSQLLATITSMHVPTSLLGYYTRFHGGLLSWLSYALLYWALVSNLRAKQVKPLILTSLTSAGLISLYAIGEHFGHSLSCLLIQGQFGVECWIQDVQHRVFASFGQPNWLAAYLVTLLPINLALLFRPYSLSRCQAKSAINKISGKTILLWVNLLLMFAALLFTRSRSGFLGGAIGLGLTLITLELQPWLRHRARKKQDQLNPDSTSSSSQLLNHNLLKIGVVGSLLGLSLIFGTPFTPKLTKLNLLRSLKRDQATHTTNTNTTSEQNAPNLKTQPSKSQAPVDPSAPPATAKSKQPTTLNPKNAGTDSAIIRKIVWRGALKVWRRYPILGSGVETFAYSYYLDRPAAHNLVSEWDFLYNKAHNEFLNFLATTGLVGLVAYCGLLLALGYICLKPLLSQPLKLKSLKQNWPGLDLSSEPNNGLALGALAGLIALSISNFFGFSTVMVTVLMFVLPGLVVLATEQGQLVFTKQADSQVDRPDRQTNADNQANSDNSARSRLNINQIITLILTSLIALHLLFTTYTAWQADHAFTQGKNLLAAQQYQAGLSQLQTAITLSPQQALFYDQLAQAHANIAAEFAKINEATAAAKFENLAITAADRTLRLNPHHLPFYKSRARLLATLSLLDEQYLDQAKQTLLTARKLAPTDPKLVYQQALIEQAQHQPQEAIATFQQALNMKSDYHQALYQLALAYEQQQQYAQALKQYQQLLNLLPHDQNVENKIKQLEASVSAQNKTGNEASKKN